MSHSSSYIEFQNVSFIYDSNASPLFDRLSLRLGRGLTGIIGPNGAGKTTLLRIACRLIEPTSGHVIAPSDAIYCPQRTDDPPADLHELIESTDADACTLRGRLRVERDWLDRWATLSHGERKRAQIACALLRDPSLLAIDEPTNHIDRDARTLLEGALRAYRGIGLLVSHDRELLDSLCAATVFIDPPSVNVRPGGYTKATELAHAERLTAVNERENAKREMARLQRTANARRHEASQADRKRSKRHLAKGDSDGRAKIDLARVSGKDGKAGRSLKQLEGRVEQTRDRLDATFVKKEHRLGIELLGEPSKRNVLLQIPPMSLSLGESRVLHVPELTVRPTDRIAIVGPNGAGKSTLIRHLLSELDDMPHVYLAQEIDAHHARAIIGRVRGFDPRKLGEIMSIISCLGSRPQRLLETDQPSPGELRKLLLAEGMSRRPNAIIMDEPTNHLDLPSIKCLEDALEQVRCALILVSHDMRFLNRLTRTTWELRPEAGDTHIVSREKWLA